jgi:hypothetical protein
LLRAAQLLNEAYLRAHPETPWLYASGVRYAVEPPEIREEFACIPIVLGRLWGDCDDLATWRAAELNVRRGMNAVATILHVGDRLWHCVVKFPDGRHECPSAVLGMGRP